MMWWRLGVLMLAGTVLAACQTSGPSREPVRTSAADMYFNTALFVANADEIVAEHSRTDRGLSVTEEARVGSDYIFIQHVIESWFNDRVVTEFRSRSEFDKFFQEATGRKPTNVRDLSVGSRTDGGFHGMIGACEVFRVAKRVKKGTIYDNDYGDFDTIITGVVCGDMKLDFDALFASIDRMRAADRERLSGKTAENTQSPEPKRAG